MKKFISFVLAVSMILSLFASALVFSADETGIIAGTNGQTAGNKNNLYAHDKTATPLYKNDYTDVTLTVGGDQRELTSDIVLIIGHRPTENITYMTDLINRIMTASDGSRAKIKLGIVGFAHTTEDELVLPLTEMIDTVPGNTMAEYRFDDQGETETDEQFAERKAAYEANVAEWDKDPELTQDMEYILARALEECEKVYAGVNLESSMITARDMLKADTSVPAERKHFIVVSSGLTYVFDGDDNDSDDSNNPAAFVPVEHNGYLFYNDRTWRYFRNANNNTYPVPKWYNDKNGKDDWMAYWNTVVSWIEADQNSYVYTLSEPYGTFTKRNNRPAGTLGANGRYTYHYAGNAILKPGAADIPGASVINLSTGAINPTTPGSASAHAFGYERAQYEAYIIFREMSTKAGEKFVSVLKDSKTGEYLEYEGLGYNCYSVYAALNSYSTNGYDDNGKDLTSWTSGDQYIGHSFMNYLAGGTAPVFSFTAVEWLKPVENKIIYSLSSGTKVVDTIGYSEKDGYDFDFVDVVDGSENLPVLTYGDDTYFTKKLDVALDGATATYVFSRELNGEPTFTMNYYAGEGENEYFDWIFGENISSFKQVKLTYTLKLVERNMEIGRHTPDTNVKAVIHPIDSENKKGNDEEFPIPHVEYIVVPDGEYDGPDTIDKSKTATPLYNNRFTDVTLSLPGEAETLASDIVFVVDKSSSDLWSGEEATSLFNQLIDLQKNTGALINVGLVIFDYSVHAYQNADGDYLCPLDADLNGKLGEYLKSYSKWTEIDENGKTITVKGENYAGGTNADAGLTVAKEILDAHEGVEASRKHVVFISDGLTWLFYEDADDETIGVGTPYNILLKSSDTKLYGDIGIGSWCEAHKVSPYVVPGGSWDAYWAKLPTWVAKNRENDIYKTDYSLYTNSVKPVSQALHKSQAGTYAFNLDRGIYEAWESYVALEESGYNCYAINTQKNKNYVGYFFMNMLNGGTEFNVEDLGNKVFYLISKGSKVVDYIGYSDDATEGYDFDFIDQIDGVNKYPVLKVGANTYFTTKLATPVNGATISYVFSAEEGGEATFSMDYYKGNNPADEYFVWTINEDVSRFAPVSLTYTLDLVDRSEIPGDHKNVDTNQKAILYPKDSDGNDGAPEVFEKPKVEYTVYPVDVTVTKIWNDDHNRDGVRPESITLNLFDDTNTLIETVTLNSADFDGDTWSYTFTGLREFRDGKAIKYHVTENPVDNYTTVVDELTITNTHTPDKTTISGVKTWIDGNDQDGLRPDEITIRLNANGKEIASVVVTAKDGWKFSFTNLNVNENGNKIVYTISEDSVDGYETSIDGYNVTNTHVPSLKGDKTTESLGDHRFEVNVSVPGGDGKDIHDEVIVMVDGSTSVDGEWPSMREAIMEIGRVFLDGTGKTKLTLMAFGMSPTVVAEHVKDIDELDELLVSYQGDLLYGRSSTNCAGAFDGINSYINQHDDTLRDAYVIFITDGGINMNNLSEIWHNYASKLSVAYADGALQLELARILYQDAARSAPLTKIFGDKVDKMLDLYDAYSESCVYDSNGNLKSYDKDIKAQLDAVMHIADESGKTLSQLYVVEAFNAVFDFAGLNKEKAYPIYVVEKAFMDYKARYNVGTEDAFYYTAVTVKSITYKWSASNKPCTIDAAKVTASLVKELYLVQYGNKGSVADWMTEIDRANVQHVGAGSIDNLPETIKESLSELVLTPYLDVVVTDYMSKWVILDPVTIKVLDANGNVVAEFDAANSPVDANGNYTGYVYKWVGEPLCKDKAPIILDLIPESEYAAGGPDVIGNADGPIYRITWNLKDGALLRTDVFTLQYVVIANTEEPGFVYGKDLPSNGDTYLEYKDEKGDDHKEEIKVPDIIVDETFTSVEGFKTWIDGNDQDGIRPEKITVILLADGEEVARIDVTEADNWTFKFTDLPVYKNGAVITYEIVEAPVEGYEVSYNVTNNGIEIVNTHVPEETEIEGTKTWIDNNDQDGIRPEKITVILRANGKEVARIDVTEADNWSFKFTDLPKFENGEEITYSVEEVAVEGYKTTYEGFNIINTHVPEEIEIEGTKTWIDNNDQDGIRPEKITVILRANGEEVARIDVTEADNWTFKFSNLPVYKNGNEIVYEIVEAPVEGYEVSYNVTNNGIEIVNTHVPEETEIEGTKTWIDNDNQDGIRPEKITVILRANGKEVARIDVTEADNWAFKFTDLPKFENGEEIVYSVEEVAVDGYKTTYEDFNIINTHVPEEIEIEGTKTWIDNNDQDGIRPEKITVILRANGKEVARIDVTEADNWSFKFTELPKFENGEEIVYGVEEVAVDGYKATYEGFNIINTHVPEETEIEGTKTWIDNNDQDGIRPDSIVIVLFADGEEVARKTVTKDDWTFKFSGLPVYKNGNKIVYEIFEAPVDGYETTYDGYNVINTHVPDVTSVSGSKIWKDNDNQDGIRPESVIVILLADGAEVARKTVNSDNNWAFSFTNLPKYKDGVEIKYTVKEVAVEGYETTYEGFNIINTHVPDEIEISGSKTWIDNNNQDGIRPDSIVVNLLANGEKVAEKIVTAANNWSFTFTDLPKYKNGAEIKYEISEAPVTGYETSYDGFNVINTHVPEKIQVSVLKIWDDQDDIALLRPVSIIVNFFADGVKIDSCVLSEATGWTYTLADLDKYVNGAEIAYTITEEPVEHYDSVITGNAKDGYVVTNTYIFEIPEEPVPETSDRTLYGAIATAVATIALGVAVLLKRRSLLEDAE